MKGIVLIRKAIPVLDCLPPSNLALGKCAFPDIS